MANALDRIASNPQLFPKQVSDSVYDANPIGRKALDIGGEALSAFTNIPSDLYRVGSQYGSSDPRVRRNPLEVGLGVGNALIGKPLGTLFSAFTPDVPDFIAEPVGRAFQSTGIPQAIGELAQENPRLFRGIDEAGGSIPFLRAIFGGVQGLQRLSQNLVNNLQRSPETQFYLSRSKAEEIAKRENPDLRGAELDNAIQQVQTVSRIKATQSGLSEGIGNFIKQSFSPQQMAEFNQRGVSQTAINLANNPNASPAELFGQFAYEALVGKGFQNLKPILKKLDNEYFTHTGIASIDQFKKFAKGVKDKDAEAFYRTIMASQGVSNPQRTILVARQPTQTSKSGQLRQLAVSSGKVPRALPTIFPLAKPHTAETFLRAHKVASRARPSKALSTEQSNAIKQAFKNNPALSTITDPEQLKVALADSLTTNQKFPVTRIVNDVVFNSKQTGFKSNVELREALEAKIGGRDDMKIITNSTQTNLPDNKRDIFITTSEISDAFELGGVGIVYRIKPNGAMSAVIHDTNDLFGMDAPGALKTVVATPPITKSLLDMEDPASVFDLPKKSEAVQEIAEELRTPVQPTARDYADVGANVGATTTAIGGLLVDDPTTEENPLAPTIE